MTLAVLLSLLLPLNAPWWLVVTGCFIMIVIGKKFFGGLGAYPVNPVLLSIAMLRLSWPQRFDYTAAILGVDWSGNLVEPLRLMKTIGSEAASAYDWQELLFGWQVAGIGNALVLYLFIGGIFLVLIRQVPWQIPVSFLAGGYCMGIILHLIDPVMFAQPQFYLLSGSMIFGAFFLAGDATTSPVNRIPMFIYGLLGGVLTVVITSFSIFNDGVVFAILLINLCAPLLDRTTPKVYGLEASCNA